MVARLAFFTAALAALSALAAPTQQMSKRAAACDTANPEYVDNLTCPAVQLLSGFLSFQGDNVGQNAINILSEANELLLSDDPVSKIGSDVTGGIVSGVTDGVVFTLKGLAATIPQLNPGCACNMVACNSALQDAIGQCNIGGSDLSPQSCGQAIYSCSQFYSRNEINAVAPCCSTYEFGQTSDESAAAQS